jgi:hypothetical protein
METLARPYFVKQRFKWVANHYDVFAGEGDTAPHVAFAKQKALKLKEEVTFWSDDTEMELLAHRQVRRAVHGKAIDLLDARIGIASFVMLEALQNRFADLGADRHGRRRSRRKAWRRCRGA